MTPPDVAAARTDLWCTGSALSRSAYWMRALAGIPQTASVWHAHTVLTQRAASGDLLAARKLAEFTESATAYEAARVAAGGAS